MNHSIVKHCAVGAVLAAVAMLPKYQQLHTSPDGLKLLADYEGCRLMPYQCSAGIWTDGIGNTEGVVPGRSITGQQAAGNLITNVLRVESALAQCVTEPVPQSVYDSLVSLAFNVGTTKTCGSTMVKLLNEKRWRDACQQLPRWIYVKGVFNPGLKKRRAREMAWCLTGI
ncbi:Phage lysozyme [Erwinia sp. Ejp617]|nr:lysozyme [Erwinia sp. Ejp617]ADP10185.1 Phage lysozyme [Erwinia sp. Ejp617]